MSARPLTDAPAPEAVDGPERVLRPPAAREPEAAEREPEVIEVEEPQQEPPSRVKAKIRLMGADVAAVLLAEAIAWTLRNPMGELSELDANLAYPLLFVITPFLFLGAMASQRLYTARCVARRPDELRRLASAAVLGGLALSGLGFMLRADVSRGWVAILVLAAAVLLTLEREVARRLFARMRRDGRFVRSVLIVGRNAEANEIHTMFDLRPELGYRPTGHWPTALGTGTSADDVIRHMDTVGATGVVIAASAADVNETGRLVRSLTDRGIHVEVSSPLRDIACERLLLRPVGRFPMTYVEPVHRSGWRPAAKRAFDVAASGVAVVLLAPVLAVIAVAVRIESPGPSVFRQERVGKDGRRFFVAKFRTMVVNAEAQQAALLAANEADGPLFKIREDPRITRFGGFLRRSSLDELPQLWNVMRGDMSLVGPRPAIPSEVDAWPAGLHERLRVKPGITGMWQVHGRSGTTFDDYQRLDLYYVDNWSLLADVVILCKTVPAVVTKRGAC